MFRSWKDEGIEDLFLFFQLTSLKILDFGDGFIEASVGPWTVV